MSDKIIENNQVTIMGEVVSGFTFSHEVFGEGFYMVDVSVKRLSNSRDLIPVMISERLIDVTQDYTGEFLMVTGQFRSYNRHEEQLKFWVETPTRYAEMINNAQLRCLAWLCLCCKTNLQLPDFYIRPIHPPWVDNWLSGSDWTRHVYEDYNS